MLYCGMLEMEETWEVEVNVKMNSKQMVTLLLKKKRLCGLCR